MIRFYSVRILIIPNAVLCFYLDIEVVLGPIHEVVYPLWLGGAAVRVLRVPECREGRVNAGVRMLPEEGVLDIEDEVAGGGERQGGL